MRCSTWSAGRWRRATWRAAWASTRLRPRRRSRISSAGAWRGGRRPAGRCQRRALGPPVRGLRGAPPSRARAGAQRPHQGRAGSRERRHPARHGAENSRPARSRSRPLHDRRPGRAALLANASAADQSRRPRLPHPRSDTQLIREAKMDSPHPPALSKPADPYRINGLVFEGHCDPSAGTVHWDTVRSIWNGAMLAAALVLGPIYFTWSALCVFLTLCLVTLCAGHSVGFHRRLIHRSFKCPKWLERILIYLGTM